MKTKDLQNEYLVVFKSQNHAIYIYSKLNDKKIKTKIIQTPCSISTSCTHSVRFNEENVDAVITEIKNSSIKIKGIYKIERNGAKKTYKKIQL
ncbi:Conserved hypothetical protein [Clostridium acetobutylicum EA 2018]|nr:Conserved hypothetical protein [Clostridium acetobutylicum EA 2018]OOL99330.1 hypothetical protein CLACE_08550 [Clostridium acetobutylicum]OOM04744.1 hypothetical protein CLABU_34050 [Clostridium acetobutylicum]